MNLTAPDVETLTARIEDVGNAITEIIDDGPNEFAALLVELAALRVEERRTLKIEPERKRKLTVELIQRVAGLVAMGCSQQGAAESCGVPSGTHHRWLDVAKKAERAIDEKSDCDVTDWQRHCLIYRDSLRQAALMCEGNLIRTVQRQAQDDWRAATFLLARRFPKRWGSHRERGTVEVNANVNANVAGVLAVAPVAGTVDDWEESETSPASIDIDEIPKLESAREVSVDVPDDD